MKFTKGQIVTSRSGRDNGRSYVVVSFEKDRLLLANGTKFTVQSPKKKNIRHLVATKSAFSESVQWDNQTIMQALSAFDSARKADVSGG